jgi:soluble lytic murein transglycosylase
MVNLKNSTILVSLFFLFPAAAEYKTNPQLSRQQNAFLESYAALKKGEILDNTSLEDYILYPYLEYQLIRQHTRLTPDKTLEKFIRRFGNSPMADKLWTVWLGRLVMRKQWQTVIDYYKKDTGGIAAKCYFLEAQIQYALANNNPAGNALNVYLEEAKELWLSARRRPSTCNSLFAILKQKGRIDDEAYWQRIALVMDKGKTRLANELAQHLNDNDKERVKLWIKLRKAPEKYLADVLQKDATDNQADKNRQLIVYGLKRLARKKTDLAKNLWTKFQQQTTFTEKQKGDVQSYFGIRDALNHSPYALRRLASIPPDNRSEKGNLWLARMAIRSGDWKKYLNAYKAMNEEQQKRDVWRYWRAHALYRNGSNAVANKLFKDLASDASFYGFLSADRLKLDYQRLRQKPKDWSKCTPKIAALSSIKRAV